MFTVCRDTPAIQHRLNFSSENRCLILVEQSPPPAICVCSPVALLLQRERDGKSGLCSPFEGGCHAGPVSSVWHCSVFDRSLSLEALTHALCSTSACHIFSRTPGSIFFFFPAKPDLLFSVYSVFFFFAYFSFDFCVHQIIFAYDKLPLNVPLNVQLCKGESVYSSTDSKAQVALLWKCGNCLTVSPK